MSRQPGTKADGSPFNINTIEAVWFKGVPTMGSNRLRKDRYGGLMERSEYGTCTARGWVIDHIIPLSKGGTDSISNLQPLNWKNNQSKRDQLLDLGNKHNHGQP